MAFLWHIFGKLCSLHLTKVTPFQIAHRSIQKILSAAPPSESNALRVDFRSVHVHYLNNLEEDSMYRQWPTSINEVCFLFSSMFSKGNCSNQIFLLLFFGLSLSSVKIIPSSLSFQILMPVFPGQLRYIRKNFFHAIYVLDPATACGAEACYSSHISTTLKFSAKLYQFFLFPKLGSKIFLQNLLVNLFGFSW